MIPDIQRVFRIKVKRAATPPRSTSTVVVSIYSTTSIALRSEAD